MSDPVTDLTNVDRDRPVAGFDEMLGPDGELRDHWRYVIGSLQMLGRSELVDRQGEATALLRRGRPADPGPAAADTLDLIPLLVSSDDWSTVEAGLVQRAELLDLVLVDLYGTQELLQRGIVPAEIVHRHPGYLRAVVGDRVHGDHRLVHYAADLSRRDDGRFVVLADHGRIPAGLGAALEHRLALSRVFPSLFRDAHVHRLAHFFRGVRTALDGLNPSDRDDPGIVVLTPGPADDDYAEHSALASYLGYPLAEPADLTVRRGRVWLRSLAGLQPVDVVLRWVGDELADPLELIPGTGTGVPGFVEAGRRGTVAIANPIGSALIDNPGLLPFLADAADHLLGSPLQLDSIESWWCGRPRDLDHALEHLESLVFVPIDQFAPAPLHGSDLPMAARDRLIAEVRADPQRWIAHQIPDGGWAPSLMGDRFERRPVSVRAHLIARAGSFVALPGGVARTPASGCPVRVPHPGDGRTTTVAKDVWVLASEPERAGTSLFADTGGTGPLVVPAPPTIAGTLPSRSAENLFWAGRYRERAEQAVRWARMVLARVADVSDEVGSSSVWLPDLLAGLRMAVSADGGAAASEASDDEPADPIGLVATALFPSDADTGLPAAIAGLTRNLGTVRDLVSGDTWPVLHALADELDRVRRSHLSSVDAALPALDRLLTSLIALSGLTAESTVRDPVWLFLDAGQRLERAHQVVATARPTLGRVRDIDSDALVHESVLIANDSLITYRRRYRSRLRITSVLDLLVGDPSNPRSLVYQLDRLSEHAASLPVEPDGGDGDPGEVADRLAALTEHLRISDLTIRVRQVDGSRRTGLDELLDEAGQQLTAIGDALGRRFLHVERPRALDEPAEDGVGS